MAWYVSFVSARQNLSRIILDRLKESVDRVLQEEQKGFRKKRSCVDNIFILQTITEQKNEWYKSLYIYYMYIDFEKAFNTM